MARITGLRPNTISHLCSDNVDRVYLSTLETVCKVLDIDIQELIEVEQSSCTSNRSLYVKVANKFKDRGKAKVGLRRIEMVVSDVIMVICLTK